MHNTTNTKPPDIRVDDNDATPLRTAAFATAGFQPYQFRKTRAGLKLEKELGPGLPVPPRRVHLLNGSTEKSEGNGPESVEVNNIDSPAQSMRSPNSHKLTKWC